MYPSIIACVKPVARLRSAGDGDDETISLVESRTAEYRRTMSPARTQVGAVLSQPDAVALAHALSGYVGVASESRVLSIKGPAADYYGLRRPHQSADADVIVPPQDFQRFCSALEARGWHQRVARSTPALIEPHSRTYIHPDWSCDIDVHDRFPGFFAAPDAVFDMLWDRRSCLTIGHACIQIPSLEASAVVGLLHALRNMSAPRHRAEWAAIIDALTTTFTSAQREEFIKIAEGGRARWVLRDAFEAMGRGPVERDLTDDEWQIWSNHSLFAADGGAVGWVLALRQGSLRQRASTLARAIWVPRAMIPRNDESTIPSAAEVLSYQWDRWVRGARAIGHFARLSNRSR